MCACSKAVSWNRDARGIRCAIFTLCSLLLWAFLVLPDHPAGPMTADPNGFYGFQWGALLADVQDLIKVESGEHIQKYELKQGPPKVGDAVVDSLRFVTFDGQFARVTIHYHGAQTHNTIMVHLESVFGPIDRTPGAMMRGLGQQFTWRGPQSEINLTYDGTQERGYIFIENRTLAPRFNDSLPE